MNGLLTAWIWLGEGGKIFDGRRAKEERLILRVEGARSGERWKPILRVGAEWKTAGGGWEKKGLEGKYMEWVDEEGVLNEERLGAWLVGGLPFLKQGHQVGMNGEDGTSQRENVSSRVEGLPRAVGAVGEKPTGGKKGRKKG